MPFGVKEEKYYVAYDEQGRRVLKPKDRATEEFLAKKMAKQFKRKGKEQTKEKAPGQLDSEHIEAMEKAYRQREKAKKLKEKERKRKEWAKIKQAIGKTQATSRESMNLSMYGRQRKPTKSTRSRGGKNYTIIDGVAYLIYKKKKQKKKDKFSWDDFSLDDKDFKMPNWGDMFD